MSRAKRPENRLVHSIAEGDLIGAALQRIDADMYDKYSADLTVNSQHHRPTPRIFVPSLQPSHSATCS